MIMEENALHFEGYYGDVHEIAKYINDELKKDPHLVVKHIVMTNSPHTSASVNALVGFRRNEKKEKNK